MEYSNIKDYIKAIEALFPNKIYIVGAGRYGEILGRYFDTRGFKWEGYVDKRASLKNVNEKNVYGYDDIDASKGYYIISTYYHREEIFEDLKIRGIDSERIIAFENQEVFYDIYGDLVDWKKYTVRLKEFHNKHKDKRCFIIGNGPSLKIEDLEKTGKDITFASNSIYALYSYIDWRPTYYCAWDPIFCENMMSDKENMQKILDGCNSFFTSMVSSGIQYKYIDNIYFMRTLSERAENGLPCFSEDCSDKVYLSGTITYGILQLAVYMGFKEIYLLGVDCSYSVERHDDSSITQNDVCDHMTEIEEENKKFYKHLYERCGFTCMTDIDLHLAGYKAAKAYADLHKIKICNATRGGKLEAFPRVNFDVLF